MKDEDDFFNPTRDPCVRGTGASSSVVISARGVDAHEHLGYQRLNTENEEILARQALFEALMIELMFLFGESQQAFTLVGDPLPRTLFP
jgi:hypothetical protein